VRGSGSGGGSESADNKGNDNGNGTESGRDVNGPDGKLESFSSEALLQHISSQYLAKRYGGDIEDDAVFTFVDPIYRDLVGVSAEPDPFPSGFEEYAEADRLEMAKWKQQPLRSSERSTERIKVKRGDHYKWRFMAENERTLFFGVTFEADGFRGKSIQIIVRPEEEQQCGHCPMFGDFIVLKEGMLIFQFRNTKSGRRLNLRYKIECDRFPTHFINKHLPDYHAEERLLQSKTLNIGGKRHQRDRAKSAKTHSTRSVSEYSGSTATALSTSPPPETALATTKSAGDKVTTMRERRRSITTEIEDGSTSRSGQKKKPKRSRSKSSNKKSMRSSKKTKKKSKATRAKTPDPHTPVTNNMVHGDGDDDDDDGQFI